MLIALCSMGLNAQIKGMENEEIIKYDPNAGETPANEKWLTYNGSFMKVYKNTPIGIGHSAQDLIKLLIFNDLEYADTEEDNSIISASVESPFDYEALSASVKIEASEIEKKWLLPGWRIVWLVDASCAIIYVAKLKE